MAEDEPDGATPLDPDEARDLIPGHIVNRSQLNVWEQENIIRAAVWTRKTRKPALAEDFIRDLHRRMFDKTWRWAGIYRTSNKNIGVDWPQVATQVRILVGDGDHWVREAAYPLPELALRFHHRLVQIHLFPNGNGRHARLWADTMLLQSGQHPLRWKAQDLDNAGAARTAYISALRAADRGDYAPLNMLVLGR